VRTHGVLCAYSRGTLCVLTGYSVRTHGVLLRTHGVLCAYSRGTHGVLTGYSVRTHGVLCAYSRGTLCVRVRREAEPLDESCSRTSRPARRPTRGAAQCTAGAAGRGACAAVGGPTQSRRRCGAGWAHAVPAPTWAGVSPMQCRRRCGAGWAHAVPAPMWAGVSPFSAGADVGRG
jgi:hypothetical protein